MAGFHKREEEEEEFITSGNTKGLVYQQGEGALRLKTRAQQIKYTW